MSRPLIRTASVLAVLAVIASAEALLIPAEYLGLGFTQSGLPGGMTPDQLARLNARSSKLREADKLIADGRLEEAIAVLRSAVEDEVAVDRSDVLARYRLAKALLLSGESAEGLLEFKRCFRWDAKKQDLRFDLSDVGAIGAEYAIALARAGRLDDTVHVYYWALRKFSGIGDMRREPIPFAIVFDPDSHCIQWEKSQENLILAATMLKQAQRLCNSENPELKWVRETKPDWFFAIVYQAHCSGKTVREGMLQQAEALPLSARERIWLLDYRSGINPQEETKRLVRESEAVTQSLVWLRQNHSTLASGPIAN